MIKMGKEENKQRSTIKNKTEEAKTQIAVEDLNAEQATAEFCGCVVLADCLPHGVYQGTVLAVDPISKSITIASPLLNGVVVKDHEGKPAKMMEIPSEILNDIQVMSFPSNSPYLKNVSAEAAPKSNATTAKNKRRSLPVDPMGQISVETLLASEGTGGSFGNNTKQQSSSAAAKKKKMSALDILKAGKAFEENKATAAKAKTAVSSSLIAGNKIRQQQKKEGEKQTMGPSTTKSSISTGVMEKDSGQQQPVKNKTIDVKNKEQQRKGSSTTATTTTNLPANKKPNLQLPPPPKVAADPKIQIIQKSVETVAANKPFLNEPLQKQNPTPEVMKKEEKVGDKEEKHQKQQNTGADELNQSKYNTEKKKEKKEKQSASIASSIDSGGKNEEEEKERVEKPPKKATEKGQHRNIVLPSSESRASTPLKEIHAEARGSGVNDSPEMKRMLREIALADYNGHLLSVDCGKKGLYQGRILSLNVEEKVINLATPLRDGKPIGGKEPMFAVGPDLLEHVKSLRVHRVPPGRALPSLALYQPPPARGRAVDYGNQHNQQNRSRQQLEYHQPIRGRGGEQRNKSTTPGGTFPNKCSSEKQQQSQNVEGVEDRHRHQQKTSKKEHKKTKESEVKGDTKKEKATAAGENMHQDKQPKTNISTAEPTSTTKERTKSGRNAEQQKKSDPVDAAKTKMDENIGEKTHRGRAHQGIVDLGQELADLHIPPTDDNEEKPSKKSKKDKDSVFTKKDKTKGEQFLKVQQIEAELMIQTDENNDNNTNSANLSSNSEGSKESVPDDPKSPYLQQHQQKAENVEIPPPQSKPSKLCYYNPRQQQNNNNSKYRRRATPPISAHGPQGYRISVSELLAKSASLENVSPDVPRSGGRGGGTGNWTGAGVPPFSSERAVSDDGRHSGSTPLPHTDYGCFRKFEGMQQPIHRPPQMPMKNHPIVSTPTSLRSSFKHYQSQKSHQQQGVRRSQSSVGPSIRSGNPMHDYPEEAEQYRHQHHHDYTACSMLVGPINEEELKTEFDFDANNALFDKGDVDREVEQFQQQQQSADTDPSSWSKYEAATGGAGGVCCDALGRNYRHNENIVQDLSRVYSWTMPTSGAGVGNANAGGRSSSANPN